MSILGIAEVADLATTVVNKIWPDKSEQEKAQIAAAVQIVQGQLDINKVEAASPSVFVSGWRPFIGWVCGSACAWNWIGLPIMKAAVVVAGYTALNLQPADLSEMLPVLLGMLGLGTLRTVEKIKGTK
jgi:Holin of 3TMs, for gene-transfer release